MNWETKSITGIKANVGKRTKIVFKAVKELPKIALLQSSCGCSTPDYNKKTRELIVSFKPGKIPLHLRNQGYYTTSKTITITYDTGVKDVLTFTSTVNKK